MITPRVTRLIRASDLRIFQEAVGDSIPDGWQARSTAIVVPARSAAEELRRTIRQVQRELKITTVLVTHDQEEAFALADRIGVMNLGRLLESGRPDELYDRPATRFVATFLGTPPANLLPVQRVGESLVFGETVLAPAALAAGQEAVQLLYRAEDVGVGAVAGMPTLNARFAEAAPIAGRTMVTALAGDQRITAMADGYFTAMPGEPITLSFIRTPDAVFAATGERIHQ